MATLKLMCEQIGLTHVQTYIASGNVVFSSPLSKTSIKTALEAELLKYAGKEVGVIMRTAAELKTVLEQNPFADKKPNQTVALFLDKKPPKNSLEQLGGQVDEDLVVGSREIYVHYPSGMARTKLKFPAQKLGTARNINTIRKMVELCG